MYWIFLCLNKDGFQEFVSTHGEVCVMNVVDVLSKLNIFRTLIDRSTIHGKQNEGVCIQ